MTQTTKKRTSLPEPERQQLANQYRILEKLSEGSEAKDFGRRAEILERGYTYLYDDQVFDQLWDEQPKEIAQEVIDILDLYRALHRSFERLAEPDKAKLQKQIEFGGFDGNNESAHLGFAHFYCDGQDRYVESNIHNCHRPTLVSYRSQLQKWDEMGREFQLSKTQMEQLIAAYRYWD